MMTPVKRIEIITGVRELDDVKKILDRFGIRGYVIHNAISGKGNRSVALPNPLTGEFEDRLITTTCTLEDADELLKALTAFVKRHGGACIVYDAQCIVH